MLRVSDIKIEAAPGDHERQALEEKIKGLCRGELPPYRIARHSLDARKKPRILSVYAVDITLPPREEESLLRKAKGPFGIQKIQEMRYQFPVWDKGDTPSPVVVGAGPAGLFAALVLARSGLAPILIEQGAPVEERLKDVEAFWAGGPLKPWSNVQFGEGGAGTFSDGKLNSGIRDREGRIAYMLDCLVEAGAAESIRYEAKPHIGTDALRGVVRRLREEIVQAGGQVLFHTRLEEIETEQGKVVGIVTEDTQSGRRQKMAVRALILAIGHSARESFRRLHQMGVAMEAKPFAMGVRIQHPQAAINATQYGANPPDFLPAADYKLSAKAADGRGIYSFCMCPGGYVVNASSQAGRLCVNGMSNQARDGANANAALIVQIRPEDTQEEGLFGGMRWQEELEEAAYQAGRGQIPLQRWDDFVAGRVSQSLGDTKPACKGQWRFANLREILPDFMSRALIEAMPRFEAHLPGFERPDALLCGVESRTSSPLRILRNEQGQANISGLFPCGEGAGYAGGITSAAVDGMKEAEAVLNYLWDSIKAGTSAGDIPNT